MHAPEDDLPTPPWPVPSKAACGKTWADRRCRQPFHPWPSKHLSGQGSGYLTSPARELSKTNQRIGCRYAFSSFRGGDTLRFG